MGANMKTIIGVISMAIVLTACSEQQRQPVLTAPDPVVFVPDDRFFNCPTIRNFPDPTTLTDGQIADLLIRLDTNNRTCKRSLEAIRTQLLEARARLETNKQ